MLPPSLFTTVSVDSKLIKAYKELMILVFNMVRAGFSG